MFNRDPEVVVLQKRLIAVGLYKGQADGDFGPKTLAATLNALDHLPIVVENVGEVSAGVTVDLDPAISLLKEFEGMRAKAYLDPVGIATIGFGTTVYPDGAKVKMGDTVTELKAEELVKKDINETRLPALKKYVTVPLSNNETCALISFCYNVGVGALASSSLLKKLNGGAQKKEVAAQFSLWNKAGGKVLPGLTRRRKAEADLFLTA